MVEGNREFPAIRTFRVFGVLSNLASLKKIEYLFIIIYLKEWVKFVFVK
jgi:hypothetical protein